MTAIDAIHDLAHRVTGIDYPHSHWWIVADAVLVFVVAPAWTLWLVVRAALRRCGRTAGGFRAAAAWDALRLQPSC